MPQAALVMNLDGERSGSPRVIRFIKHWSPAVRPRQGMQSSMIWIRGATAYRILRRERRMLTAALGRGMRWPGVRVTC